jgi:hypothetical protein
VVAGYDGRSDSLDFVCFAENGVRGALELSLPWAILALAGLLEFDMRAFLIACGAALLIAVAAAYLLEGFQEPSSKSFSTQAVRL